jgi:hypothetical protein
MRFLFILYAALFSTEVFSQSIIRAKVVDPDGAGIPYATVGIDGHGHVGTFASDKGEFELRIPNFVVDGRLIVSSLGYNKKIIKIAEIRDGMIRLEHGSIVLKEVIVAPESELIKLGNAAIKRIPKNYPNKVHYSTAFYRKISTDSVQYTGLVESILWIKDPGFQRELSQVKIEAMQSRYGDNLIAVDSALMKAFNKMTKQYDAATIGSLNRTYEQNLIRLYMLPNTYFNSKGKLFGPKPKEPLKRTIDLEDITVVSGDTIMHLLMRTFLPDRQFEEIHLAINKKDKAIIEYSRGLFDNYWVSVKFERRANGRYYLSQLKTVTPVFYPADRTKAYYNIELLEVDDIEFKTSKRNAGVVQVRDEIFDPSKIPYDPAFWQSYEQSHPRPINYDILKSLEKDRPLEVQFKER